MYVYRSYPDHMLQIPQVSPHLEQREKEPAKHASHHQANHFNTKKNTHRRRQRQERSTSTMTDLRKNQSTDELTKPGLYSFYDNSINDNDTSIYDDLPSNIAKHPAPIDPLPRRRKTLTQSVLQSVVSTLLLGVLGIVFNQMGQHIHDNHILVPELASKPLKIGFDVTHNLISSAFNISLPRSIAFAIEGVFFGSIVPLVDRFVFGDKVAKTKGIDNSSIIRAGVAFLGVAFAVRRIDWASSLQAAVAWALLNPCLWLLFDGTASGLLTSSLLAALSMASVLITDVEIPMQWFQDSEFLATILWVHNFIFFGLIVFGNIGRFLWG